MIGANTHNFDGYHFPYFYEVIKPIIIEDYDYKFEIRYI